MRSLIVEDDEACRKVLGIVLQKYGQCDFAENGKEAIASFRRAMDDSIPYDLICMDIMMPEISGHDALLQIREIENQMGIPTSNQVKVVMTTAVNAPEEVADALYKGGASAYFVKPIHIEQFVEELKKIGLIQK
jgi:two-component system chemotaxis response regulator CheY